MTTSHAQSQIRAPSQSNVYLTLVTIHTTPPTRMVNNNVNVVSRGNTFTAMPLSVELSPDDGDTMPSARVIFDNITLEAIDWVRALTTPIEITIETIFSGEFDVVEQSISNLLINKITYDQFSITAVLSADDDLNQALPSDRYTALQWPGLY